MDGEAGAGKVAGEAVVGLVIVEVLAGKMEDGAVFEFEEIVGAFFLELMDAESTIGGEAGGDEQIAFLELAGGFVDFGVARQARVVQQEGDGHHKRAQVEKDHGGHNAGSGMTEEAEHREGSRGESQASHQPN